MTRLLHLSLSLLVVATAFFSANSAPAMPNRTNQDNDSPLPYALVAQTGNSQTVTRLDPRTLDDLPGEADTNMNVWPADSPIAIRFEQNQRTIVVLDSRTLAEVRRFDAPELVYLTQLSRDGTRLVVAGEWHCYQEPCRGTSYYVYDTQSGQLTASFTGPNRPFFGTIVDPDVRSLYVITVDRRDRGPRASGWNRAKHWMAYDDSFAYNSESVGSWPIRITAYDLGTGAKRGSVALTDIRYIYGGMSSVNQIPTIRPSRPGFALSADDTRLAAVDALSDTVEVIDTSSMTTTTHTIHHRESALSKAARWLGLIPSSAEAKVWDGRSMEATFSADANHLYVWGSDRWIDPETSEQTGEGFGLKLIDLRTGEITNELFAGSFIENLQLAPDGQNLYLTETPTIPWTSTKQVPFTLHRLDPQTLEPLAARTFPGYVWINLLPTYLPRDT